MRRTGFAAWPALALLAVGACSDTHDAPPVPPRATPAPDRSASPRAPAAADADPAAESALLARIVHGETATAYHGLRSIVQGPRGSSRETRLRLVHAADGRTLLEWQGSGGTARRRWSVGSRFPWIARPELLLRNYHVRLDPEPSAPVAWRETRRVTITGRRAARPSLDLLVDAETWVVLAETGLDAAGAECRSARFETFEPGTPPVGDTAAVASGGVTADADGSSGGSGDAPVEPLAADGPSGRPLPEGFRPLTVADLPDGFERIGSGMSPCGAWREDFTDGLATLSVLQRPAAAPGAVQAPAEASGAQAQAAPEIRRRTWLGGVRLETRIGGIQVTVAGSAATEDVLRALRGLREPSPER